MQDGQPAQRPLVGAGGRGHHDGPPSHRFVAHPVGGGEFRVEGRVGEPAPEQRHEREAQERRTADEPAISHAPQEPWELEAGQEIAARQEGGRRVVFAATLELIGLGPTDGISLRKALS